MPILKNPRHERFCQALAKGETADQAYVTAGYKENRGNAARLKAKQNVLNRVAEILEKAAVRTEITVQSQMAGRFSSCARPQSELELPSATTETPYFGMPQSSMM